jgi:hypothetical protein
METGLANAYEQGGFILANKRNHWSAVRLEVPAVALTVWADQIIKDSEPWILDVTTNRSLSLSDWTKRPGNTVRKKHVQFGIDNCQGQFELILLRAKDPKKEPRSVASARYWKERRGFLLPNSFNLETGEFKLALVAK